MPKKKTTNPVMEVLQTIANAIKWLFNIIADILKAIAFLIRDIFKALESLAKFVAILLLSVSGAFLIFVTALWMLTNTFGVKESPVFIEARDSVARIFAIELEAELELVEEELRMERNETE